MPASRRWRDSGRYYKFFADFLQAKNFKQMNNSDIRIINGFEHIRYQPVTFLEEDMIKRSQDFYHNAK